MVGEAAAVLMNYEWRTGEILKRGDLRHGTLQEKLTPEDYNIKGQVLSPLFTNYLPCLTVLLFPIIDHQFCKVTSVSIPKLYLPFLIEGFITQLALPLIGLFVNCSLLYIADGGCEKESHSWDTKRI